MSEYRTLATVNPFDAKPYDRVWYYRQGKTNVQFAHVTGTHPETELDNGDEITENGRIARGIVIQKIQRLN